jgi:hypothetical protein
MKRRVVHRVFVRARFKFGLVFAVISLTLLGVGGCASTTFDIVNPPEFARRISSDSDTLVEMKPLAYRFTVVEDRLVARIYNPGDEAISILGPDSYVVDPQGQSHVVTSQTIPAGAFVKLILPPLPPDRTPTGPSLSFEVSSSGLTMDNPQPKLERPGVGGAVVDTWSWPADGTVKLNFRYRIGNKEPFTHSFSIRRHKS